MILDSEEQNEKVTDISRIMEDFQSFISENLRRSDVFTRYSPNQFLILLFGSDEQSGEKVVARLQRKWRMSRGEGKPWTDFAVEEIETPGEESEAV